MEFLELLWLNTAGGTGKKATRLLGFRESNGVANGVFAGKEHD